MRAVISVALAVSLALSPHGARAGGDADLLTRFRAVVMTPEYSGRGEAPEQVRKFAAPVRMRIHGLSRIDRTGEVRRFAEALAARVPAIRIGLAGASAANFHVFVVDRADYLAVVGREIYRRRIAQAPGRCVVSAFERRGRIARSVAVIVADEGDAVFTRCLNEELAQGLGPLNDDPAAGDSVFNGGATPLQLTDGDIALLTVLYDPRVKPGMDWVQALPALAAIVAELSAKP